MAIASMSLGTSKILFVALFSFTEPTPRQPPTRHTQKDPPPHDVSGARAPASPSSRLTHHLHDEKAPSLARTPPPGARHRVHTRRALPTTIATDLFTIMRPDLDRGLPAVLLLSPPAQSDTTSRYHSDSAIARPSHTEPRSPQRKSPGQLSRLTQSHAELLSATGPHGRLRPTASAAEAADTAAPPGPSRQTAGRFPGGKV